MRPAPCSSSAGTAARPSRRSASASDVPQATVYRLFSSKEGILKALIDVSIAGDDEPVPVAERPEVRALLNAPDPGDRLAGLAAISVDINTRTAPIYRILVSCGGLRQRGRRDPRPADTPAPRGTSARGGIAGALAGTTPWAPSPRRRRPHPRTGLAGALPLARRRSEVVPRSLQTLALRHAHESVAHGGTEQRRPLTAATNRRSVDCRRPHLTRSRTRGCGCSCCQVATAPAGPPGVFRKDFARIILRKGSRNPPRCGRRFFRFTLSWCRD